MGLRGNVLLHRTRVPHISPNVWCFLSFHLHDSWQMGSSSWTCCTVCMPCNMERKNLMFFPWCKQNGTHFFRGFLCSTGTKIAYKRLVGLRFFQSFLHCHCETCCLSDLCGVASRQSSQQARTQARMQAHCYVTPPQSAVLIAPLFNCS